MCKPLTVVLLLFGFLLPNAALAQRWFHRNCHSCPPAQRQQSTTPVTANVVASSPFEIRVVDQHEHAVIDPNVLFISPAEAPTLAAQPVIEDQTTAVKSESVARPNAAESNATKKSASVTFETVPATVELSFDRPFKSDERELGQDSAFQVDSSVQKKDEFDSSLGSWLVPLWQHDESNNDASQQVAEKAENKSTTPATDEVAVSAPEQKRLVASPVSTTATDEPATPTASTESVATAEPQIESRPWEGRLFPGQPNTTNEVALCQQPTVVPTNATLVAKTNQHEQSGLATGKPKSSAMNKTVVAAKKSTSATASTKTRRVASKSAAKTKGRSGKWGWLLPLALLPLGWFAFAKKRTNVVAAAKEVAIDQKVSGGIIAGSETTAAILPKTTTTLPAVPAAAIVAKPITTKSTTTDFAVASDVKSTELPKSSLAVAGSVSSASNLPGFTTGQTPTINASTIGTDESFTAELPAASFSAAGTAESADLPETDCVITENALPKVDSVSNVDATSHTFTSGKTVATTFAASAIGAGVVAASSVNAPTTSTKLHAADGCCEEDKCAHEPDPKLGERKFGKGDFESSDLNNGVWQKTGQQPAVQPRADLTAIDGICPETQALLYDAGIYSYADLAKSDASQRMKALIPGGSRFSSIDTTGWSTKAKALIPAESKEPKNGEEPRQANNSENRGFNYQPTTTTNAIEIQRDDLTAVEGICPETQELLYDAGIYSYADLAAADADQKTSALAFGGRRFESMNTSNWSQAAKTFAVQPEDQRFENGQRRYDDLTSLYGVNEDTQQAFHSAGIYSFEDLAFADRKQLKQTLVERESKYASLDMNRCCDEAMRFVPDDCWHGSDKYDDANELELLSELNSVNEEVSQFKKMLNFVNNKVRRGSADFFAKISDNGRSTEDFTTGDEKKVTYKSDFENTITKSTAADDLTKINGIGPATSKMLAQAGIRSFADLASTDLGQLQQLIQKAGTRFQMSDPQSWLEQAASKSEELTQV